MAIVKGALQMTGGIKGVSFYTLGGSDKVIMRTKGGPTKRRMKIGPEFENVRKHQVEWAACVMFSRGLKFALGDVYRLADYNVSPVWNGLGKNIIKTDNEHIIGERSLLVSSYRDELCGFNLNRNFAFNAVLGVSPRVNVDRETLKATAIIPKINTEHDLLNIRKLPYFRLILAAGIISDIHFDAANTPSKYIPELGDRNGVSRSISTDWLSAKDIISESELTVEIPPYFKDKITEKITFILSMGIEFGNVGFGGKIEGVKRAGCSKILAVL